MTLLEKIISLYPELATYDFAFGEIQLQNDSNGHGDYIREWNHPTLQRPTDEQLAQITE
jgi:hypothetical protein